MRLSLASFIGAAVLLATPAQAGPSPEISVDDLLTAYQAICLANIDQPDAQIATATSAPFNLAIDDIKVDGIQRFYSDRLFLSVNDTEGKRYCAVIGRVANGNDPVRAAEKLKPLVPFTAAKTTKGTVFTMWTDSSGNENKVWAYMQTSEADITLATFAQGFEAKK